MPSRALVTILGFVPQAPYGRRLQTLLTGQWWAHFAFTRINITPTILRKKIEDVREAGEFDVDRELIIPRISTVTSADGARRELRPIGRERIGPILLLLLSSTHSCACTAF